MSYIIGDIFYADTTTTLALLHITSIGKILGTVGGKPAWVDPPVQLQSDWSQSNNASLDFIKNKPSIPSSQVNSDWNSLTGISQILNKPSLSTVATTGAYSDLTGKPTIPSSQVNSDWNANSGVAQILNKPTLVFSTPSFASSTTSTQLSTTKNVQVYYNFPTTMTSILGTLSVTATLQYADDVGITVNVVSLSSDSQGCSGLLNLVLAGRLQLQGIIPAGKFRKVIFSQVGGVTIPTTLSCGQEILM